MGSGIYLVPVLAGSGEGPGFAGVLSHSKLVRLTLKAINDALAALGLTARLQREEGYFYLRFGEAADWHDCTVNVPTLRSLTLAQWIGELKRLNSHHQRIMAG